MTANEGKRERAAGDGTAVQKARATRESFEALRAQVAELRAAVDGFGARIERVESRAAGLEPSALPLPQA